MKSIWIAVVAASCLVAGCDSAESQRVEKTRGELVGTWLLDEEEGGIKSRRVLVLGENGKFSDRMHIVFPDRPAEQIEYGGEWTYDGTNLKRRFLSENGRQYSGGKIRYATFPLVTVTATGFVVQDTIAGRQVAFQRAKDGMSP